MEWRLMFNSTVIVFFFFFQESDSDGANESVSALFEKKKKKKHSGYQKSETKKSKCNDSSEKDNTVELDFITDAIKATKAEKKSKNNRRRRSKHSITPVLSRTNKKSYDKFAINFI